MTSSIHLQRCCLVKRSDYFAEVGEQVGEQARKTVKEKLLKTKSYQGSLEESFVKTDMISNQSRYDHFDKSP